MTFMNTEGQTLYTQQDLDEKSSELTRAWTAEVDNANKRASGRLRQLALDWFKSEVRGGSMTKDDALGIFNGLADALGWDTVDNLSSLFTVKVSYQGDLVAVFEDIEADDDDNAIEEVSDNLSIDEVTITFDLEYNGFTQSAEARLSTRDFDPTGDLEFSAEEQD